MTSQTPLNATEGNEQGDVMQRRTPTPDEEPRRGPDPGWTIAEARRLIECGWTHQEIADEFHIRRDTLRRRHHRDNARRRARSAA